MIKIVYLKPQSGYRGSFRSDTLWGIFCWAIHQVYGEQGKSRLNNFLASYKTDHPALVISSTFPYKQIGGEKIKYFPMPILPRKTLSLENKRLETNKTRFKDDIRARLVTANEGKKVRKQKYLSEEQFFGVMEGSENTQTISDRFWEEKSEEEKTYEQAPDLKSINVTHNAIDRIKGGTIKRNNAGQLFHVAENFLKDENNDGEGQDNVGLFFLAKVNDVPLFETVLRFLTHAGLGGDRNTGKGHFHITSQDISLPQVEQPNAMVNLSLFTPTQQEVLAFNQKPDLFRYRLENRQGRLGSVNSPHFLKQPVMLFQEGSLFPLVNQPRFGQLKDVTSTEQRKILDHTLWHYGFGFMVNVQTNSDKKNH